MMTAASAAGSAVYVPLRPWEVFAHAVPDVKLVMALLLAAGAASLWIMAVALAGPTRIGGPARSFVSAVGSAAPLLGIGEALLVLFRLACHLARIEPAPTLKALSPGLAEALLVAVLGFMAAVPALVALTITQGQPAADPPGPGR